MGVIKLNANISNVAITNTAYINFFAAGVDNADASLVYSGFISYYSDFIS